MDRRVRLLGLTPLFSLILGGCSHSTPALYVDVAAVPLDVQPAPPELTIPVAPQPPPLPLTFALAGEPPATGGRITNANIARVRAAIVRDRDKSFRAIVRRLHASYVREAEQVRAQKLDAFDPVRRRILSDALTMISKQYIGYANQVGPKVAKLAVLVGFPDPDPMSRRKVSTTDGVAIQVAATAKQLRAQITKLSADFKDFSARTLRDASAETDSKLTDLMDEVARQLADADAKANEAAQKQLAQTQSEIGPLLADKPPLTLPEVPQTTIMVRPPALGSDKVRMPESASRALLVADSEAQVKSDLQVWLAVNRFQLGRKGRDRDATKEFIAWRDHFKREPSRQP